MLTSIPVFSTVHMHVKGRADSPPTRAATSADSAACRCCTLLDVEFDSSALSRPLHGTDCAASGKPAVQLTNSPRHDAFQLDAKSSDGCHLADVLSDCQWCWSQLSIFPKSSPRFSASQAYHCQHEHVLVPICAVERLAVCTNRPCMRLCSVLGTLWANPNDLRWHVLEVPACWPCSAPRHYDIHESAPTR